MSIMRKNLRKIMNDSGKSHFVYSLTCPIDKKIRWVGYTGGLDRRFESHWYQRDRSNLIKWGWILALRKLDVFPIMRMLKAFSSKQDALDYENQTITELKKTILNIN